MRIAQPPGGLHGARRIAIVAGGTAGHVLPALAVAAAWRDVEPVFFGGGGSETVLVPAAAHRLVVLPGAPFVGRSVVGVGRAAVGLAAGARAARPALDGTSLLLGFGNWAGAGAVVAAWRLGIPIVLHGGIL